MRSMAAGVPLYYGLVWLIPVLVGVALIVLALYEPARKRGSSAPRRKRASWREAVYNPKEFRIPTA